ncbi:MAG: chromate transporter, partial [Polyangiaceae bacterium]|nr:chromate transporter [Polyangiaceae bacterium]
LPGPEAQQLATYIGWLMHRTRGGLVAGTLFILPGFVVILLLSVVYALFRQVPAVDALFFGLKAAVLAVVVEAVLRIGKRAIKGKLMIAVATLAFVAIFALRVPFPAIVAGAGIFGFLGARLWPAAFPRPAAITAEESGGSIVDSMMARGALAHTRPSHRRALVVLGAGLALWFGPLLGLALVFGQRHVFVQQGLFFSQAAVVTFGGAYAVLAFVAQQAVERYGWLNPGEMLDGLGLAETTPGPLILVLQFVGFLGAYRGAGGFSPLLAGVIGSVITVWVTFVPSFLWIFLGAPYIERLRGSTLLHAAMSTVTAAVVGVVLNLSVWFTLNTAFGHVTDATFGPLQIAVPTVSTLSWATVVLAAGAMIAMLRFKVGMGWTLLGCAGLGAGYKMLFP